MPNLKQTTTEEIPKRLPPKEKVLREDLQKLKTKFEKKGWKFSQDANKMWSAVKGDIFLGLHAYISALLAEIYGHETGNHQPGKFSARFEFVEDDQPQSLANDTVIAIPVPTILPSPFEPQARRRAKFRDDAIERLGDSIKMHGLAQPIVVRRIGDFFEIVFGERRFLAAKRKGLKTINCFVRALTDAQVLELQYEENHRRMENDPLDDAFFFKFLKEKEGYTDEQLADRLGTSKKNVTDKLKLNDLIQEAVEELADGKLPLKHAYYLSKFPAEIQKEIVREQYAYKYNDISEGAASYAEFKEEIEENILRRLKTAPFDTEDERLHLKGLKCSGCQQRTGFEPKLFDEVSKDDSCLNKSCFEFKTNVHLRLQRDAIAGKLPNPENAPIEEIVKRVPLVTERSWSDETPFKEKPLTKQKLLESPECEHSILSLAIDGARKGEQVYICKNKDCEFHNPKPQLAKKEELSELDLQLLEKNFDEEVAAKVHRIVLINAMNWFNDYKPFWTFDDLVRELIAVYLRLIRWQGFEDVIYEATKDWKNSPRSIKNDEQKNAEFIQALDKSQQSQLLFLFTKLGVLQDREDIKKIASDYAELDYTLLDAEIRHELAPAEFKGQAADYLDAVRRGIPAEFPHFWWSLEE